MTWRSRSRRETNLGTGTEASAGDAGGLDGGGGDCVSELTEAYEIHSKGLKHKLSMGKEKGQGQVDFQNGREDHAFIF